LVVKLRIVIDGYTRGSLPAEFAQLIARRFAALGQPTRILLLDLLTHRGEASVGELAEAIGTSHANASKHLNVLYAERILGRRREGTSVIYRIVDERVHELCEVVCGALRAEWDELGVLLDPERDAAAAVPDQAEPERAGAIDDLSPDFA
jgi:DNA-binding transcriptional ArsR family regulator